MAAVLDEFARWVRRSYVRTREQGWDGAQRSAYLLHRGLWRLGAVLDVGTNVLKRDWDVLVVLDGLRVDTMRSVAGEHDAFRPVGTLRSVGSTSSEWIENTFVEEDAPLLARTGYVTANPFSTVLDRKRDDATPAYLDEAWRYGFDEDLGTVPPRVVTDRALVVDRDADLDRLVVHYMQPHQPFIADDAPLRGVSTMADVVESRDGGRDEWEPGSVHANNVWYMLATGEVSSEELLASYRANLELVLEEVQLLLENLATDCVAITADHGNAAGEWWMYGHPRGFLHPVVRTVPWIETEGRGPGEYEPASRREDVDTDVTNVLTALGYHQ